MTAVVRRPEQWLPALAELLEDRPELEGIGYASIVQEVAAS